MKSDATLLIELDAVSKTLENALSRERQYETSLDIARKTIVGMERENSKHRAALRRISAACGIPDSEQACRTILGLIREALGET